MNLLTAAELKRRGMAAIEEGLRRGPVYIVKRNKPAAVVLSEADYSRLAQAAEASRGAKAKTGALDWLRNHKSPVPRSRADIDAELRTEREHWGAGG